jgi:TPR repeat protein
MAYKTELQLAFSGREEALEKVAIFESDDFNDEIAANYSREKRIKYHKLLEQSDEKIAAIKSRVAEEIGAKQLQLESFKNERTEVNTRHQLGEITNEEREKLENSIKKQFDKVRSEAEALQQLYKASTSSEIGGRVPIDIDKDVDDHGNIVKILERRAPTTATTPTDFSPPGDVSKRYDGTAKKRKNVIIAGVVLLIAICAVVFILPMFSGNGPEIDALQENAAAQFNLGSRYFNGNGVEQDYAKAVELYTLAAEQGHREAQFNLGLCYRHGYGVARSYDKAVYWYTLAAEQGHADAQRTLNLLTN